MNKELIEKFIAFHEDKANYYLDWYNELVEEEHTIGFKLPKTNNENNTLIK